MSNVTELEKLTGMYLPLDSSAAEVIVAPFHDPVIVPTLKYELKPQSGSDAQFDIFWCWSRIHWKRAKAGDCVADFSVPLSVCMDERSGFRIQGSEKKDPDSTSLNPEPRTLNSGQYDRVIAAVTVPKDVSIAVAARVDGKWFTRARERGSGLRLEYAIDVSGKQLQEVRLQLFAENSGPAVVMLSWIAVADTAMLETLSRGGMRYDEDWAGLIKPVEEWKAPRFARGLMFDESHLEILRQRRTHPDWREHFLILEDRAKQAMQRRPEEIIGDFLPWSDLRYVRQRDHGREPYHHHAQLLALVGLINEDQAMIRHALRFLMCMIHTPNWCQSAESRVRGSTWDQRCFMEEMTTTSVCLIADWLDAALTDRARDLIAHSIWDRGLAFIERDCMKHEEVHHINQGPWFCRARVLGGLMLERIWPRVGNLVDRAIADLRADLENYILPDGGTDEGVGYWSLTLHAVLPALMAYARSRKLDVRTLLPKSFAESERFLATMSSTTPGNVLMDGDNSTDYLVGDTIPILAQLFPQSVYARIARATLLRERPPTYFNQYVLDGLLGFALGPESFQEPENVVPTFSRLTHVGQLTSFRSAGARSTRIHVTGCKAKPSHSHLDKGAFTLEMDGVPLLIDRGTIRYDDSRCGLMHQSYLHNVLTPVAADGTFPDQDRAQTPVIPQGHGDENRLEVEIDFGCVWNDWMLSCSRRIVSQSADQILIEDHAKLRRKGRVAFHLQAMAPFHIDGSRVWLEYRGNILEIHFPWASDLSVHQELIDYDFRPVWRLTAVSAEGESFELTTRIMGVD